MSEPDWVSYPSDEVARHTVRERVDSAVAGIVVVVDETGLQQVRFGDPGDLESAGADFLLLYSHLFDMLMGGGAMGQALQRLIDLDLRVGEDDEESDE